MTRSRMRLEYLDSDRFLRVAALAVVSALVVVLRAPAETDTDEILVTATPLPSTATQLGRNVEHVAADVLEAGSALPAILESGTSVSAAERGGDGVQADISIRGSTFQQVLVTLDGLPLVDPQTAHHNMDLPFPVSTLEQVVVIPGPGSALFGPSAFAGVVDMTPGVPSETGGRIRASVGSFETRRLEAGADVVAGSLASRWAANYGRSDGFEDGTDYETWAAWVSSVWGGDSMRVRLSAGQVDKDFGAQNFYAPFPSREVTQTTLIDLAPEIRTESGWRVKAMVRYRRHEDEFILIEDDPSFYRNLHTSDTVAERITVTTPDYVAGATAFGIERSDSDLNSSNLGDRDAATSSAFVNHRLPGDRVTSDIGLRVDHHSSWDAEVSPSVSVSVPLGDRVVWGASAARGIRPPSFTELYYSDPANRSDPTLTPEKAWGGETGVRADLGHHLQLALTGFIRDTDDLIDWVRAASNMPWQASNIGEATFLGTEVGLDWRPEHVECEASYRYTDVDADSSGLESKYALNVARHDAMLRARLNGPRGFSASVTARYRDVPLQDRYWLLGGRIEQRLGRLAVFVAGRNLLDEDYEEIPGVSTAGSYVEAGVDVRL